MAEAQNSPINLRQMERTDAAAASEIHLRAFPGFFLSLLGQRFMRQYYREICIDPDGVAMVAEVDDRIGGLVVGAGNPRGFYRRLFRRRGLLFGFLALPAIFRRPWITGRILRGRSHAENQLDDSGTFGLFSLAVDPCYSGLRLGSLLVNAFAAVVRQRGGASICLTTDRDGNQKVNEFYLRNGFALTGQFCTPEGRWMNEYCLRIPQGGC